MMIIIVTIIRTTIIIRSMFLKNLTFQFPSTSFLRLFLNVLRLVVLSSSWGILFHKEGPMKDKAF